MLHQMQLSKETMLPDIHATIDFVLQIALDSIPSTEMRNIHQSINSCWGQYSTGEVEPTSLSDGK